VTELTRLFPAADFQAGEWRLVDVKGHSIGVYNLGDRIVAYRNVCPHQGAPVCLGRLGGTTVASKVGQYEWGHRGRVLVCPWHGWEFNLETGRVLFDGKTRLASVHVDVADGMVCLRV